MPCYPCQAVSSVTLLEHVTGHCFSQWSQFCMLFFLPVYLYYVSYEIQCSHLLPYHLKDPILIHQQLFCTPLTIFPFRWSFLFTLEINPLGCWIASLLICIWKMDGEKVRIIVLNNMIEYHQIFADICVSAPNSVWNEWQHSTCYLLLPLGFLTLLQIVCSDHWCCFRNIICMSIFI